MNDDELRDRIARLDPAGAAMPVRSFDDPASRQHVEQIMSTTTTTPTSNEAPKRTNGRRPFAFVAAAAAALVVAIGAVAVLGGSDGNDDVTAMQLRAGAPDITAMCLPVEAQYLADMPVAFKGTVTSIVGTTVTLEVDEWYKGGDASAVVIDAPAGLEALIGSVDFVEGETFLVSATDGVVNYCGFSGAATPELQTVFDAAFGS